MKKRTRGLAVLLIAVMTATLWGGCAGEKDAKQGSVFTGDNDAIRVFVRSSSTYAEKLTEKFPDIKFDFYRYGGMNPTMMMNQLLQKDDFGDLCITSLQVTDEMAKDHLLDLSGTEVCSRYEPSILSQFDVEGDIYQLPGYITMRNIIYNKSMFERHGWKEPQNFQELVELCRRIRKETGSVAPIVMAGAAGGYYFTTMTTYAQAEFLYKPEGQEWTKAYQSGKAHAEEGFGKGIEMVQQLIDAEAIDYQKGVGMWDGELFRTRMLTGEAAMMFGWGGQAAVAREIEKSKQDTFALMPFYNQAGQAFIGTNIPYYIGLSKNLGEKGNEKKLEKAMEIIDWLSTEEGISALSSETLAAIYPLKKAENTNALPIYRDFWNQHMDSIKAPMLYAGYEDILAPVADRVIEAIQNKGSLQGLAKEIDEVHRDYIKGGEKAIGIGSFQENFTHLETVQMFAEILHSPGDSDVALVSDGTYKDGVVNSNGVFARFLEGPLLEDEMTCSMPGSHMTEAAVQMTLTGRQMKTLLEEGKHGILQKGEKETSRIETSDNIEHEASFDYYWAGMEVDWKKGKVEKMTLDNGKELGDDDTCTVTFADQDYTVELERKGEPKKLPYTVTEIFAEYLKEHSPIAPPAVLRK